MKEIKYCIYKYIEENFLPLFFEILGLNPIYLIAITIINEEFFLNISLLKFLAVAILPSLVILLALTSFYIFCTHSTSYIASMIKMAEHNKRKLESKYKSIEKQIDNLHTSDYENFLLKDKLLDKLSKSIRATKKYINEHKIKLEIIKVKKEIRHKMQENKE